MIHLLYRLISEQSKLLKMKKTLVSILFIGLVFSCSKENIENESIESHEELKNLSTEIVENLDLNSTQESRLKDAFTRNANESEKPGFIWLIARHLSENLPEDEKDQLIDKIMDIEVHLLDHGHCIPLGFEPNFKHPIHPTPELMSQLLEPAQLPFFQELLQHHQRISEHLIHKRIHDEITPQEFFAAMHTNRQHLLENIVTKVFNDHQHVKLAQIIEHLHQERARYIESSYGCMIASLELDEETAESLLNEIMKIQGIISDTHELLKNGEITIEEYLNMIKIDCSTYQESISSLLSEDQMDIVYLYRVLSFRRF